MRHFLHKEYFAYNRSPSCDTGLLRKFSVPNIARVVAKDTVYKEIVMKKGDLVFLPAELHGINDECSWGDFKRLNAKRHSAFRKVFIAV